MGYRGTFRSGARGARPGQPDKDVSLSPYEFLRLLQGGAGQEVSPDEEQSLADKVEDVVNQVARALQITLTAVQVAAVVARILQAIIDAVAAAPAGVAGAASPSDRG